MAKPSWFVLEVINTENPLPQIRTLKIRAARLTYARMISNNTHSHQTKFRIHIGFDRREVAAWNVIAEFTVTRDNPVISVKYETDLQIRYVFLDQSRRVTRA